MSHFQEIFSRNSSSAHNKKSPIKLFARINVEIMESFFMAFLRK